MPIIADQEAIPVKYRSLQALFFAASSVLLLSGCDILGGIAGSSTGSVTLYWSPPLERYNGDLLDDDDIAGYSIRYRHKSEYSYTLVFVENDGVNQFYLDSIKDPEETIFQIAAVDENGLYSNYETAER